MTQEYYKFSFDGGRGFFNVYCFDCNWNQVILQSIPIAENFDGFNRTIQDVTFRLNDVISYKIN